MTTKILAVVVVTLILYSCRKNDRQFNNLNVPTLTNETLGEIQSETKQRFELISLLVADVFNERSDLLDKYKKSVSKNDYQKGSEAIFFKDILANKANLQTGFANEFVTQIVAKFRNENFTGKEKVSAILSKVKNEISEKVSSARTTDDLNITTQTLLLPHLGSQLYFPFSENFANQTNLNPFYCYDPLNEAATTVEVFREINGVIQTQVVTGDDSWAEQNATIVIKFDDNIAGNQLDKYLESPCAQARFYDALCPNEVLDIDGVDSISPPPASYCGPLTYNIQPAVYPTLGDNYIFSAFIPHVKLSENLRWAFWSGSNKLALYKSKAKVIAAHINDIGKAFRDSSYQVGQFEIRRKCARKNWWVTLPSALQWSSDWRIIEYENYQAVSILKHWLNFNNADLNFNVNAGAKWDTTRVRTITPRPGGGFDTTYAPRGWTQNFNATASVAGKISYDRTREAFAGEHTVTRRSFTLFPVGDNFGLGTSASRTTPQGSPLYATTPYAIRGIGSKFQYYFRVNLCY
jgi:hypothetical protein